MSCRIDHHTRHVLQDMFRRHFGAGKIYAEFTHMSMTWFHISHFRAFEEEVRSYQFPYPLRGKGVWVVDYHGKKFTGKAINVKRTYKRVTVSFKIPKEVEE